MTQKPKLDKNLGQHFLKNAGVIEKIVRRIESLAPHKQIIEVGPGGGALTLKLLEEGFHVLVIELDQRWIALLEQNCAQYLKEGRLRIVDGDATRISVDNVKSLLWNPAGPALFCGNLPYNRGQEILLKYFEEATYIDAFVVMLQKEVIEKFTSQVGDDCYGPLAVKSFFLCEDTQSFVVSPGSFSPPPKVQSAVLSFVRKNESPVLNAAVGPSSLQAPALSETPAYVEFSKFLARSFLQRRKKYIHALKDMKASKNILERYGSFRSEQLRPIELFDLWCEMTIKK